MAKAYELLEMTLAFFPQFKSQIAIRWAGFKTIESNRAIISQKKKEMDNLPEVQDQAEEEVENPLQIKDTLAIICQFLPPEEWINLALTKTSTLRFLLQQPVPWSIGKDSRSMEFTQKEVWEKVTGAKNLFFAETIAISKIPKIQKQLNKLILTASQLQQTHQAKEKKRQKSPPSITSHTEDVCSGWLSPTCVAGTASGLPCFCAACMTTSCFGWTGALPVSLWILGGASCVFVSSLFGIYTAVDRYRYHDRLGFFSNLIEETKKDLENANFVQKPPGDTATLKTMNHTFWQLETKKEIPESEAEQQPLLEKPEKGFCLVM